MSKPLVISGEASETDSEDEQTATITTIQQQTIQGAVITGEDSESENENDASIASAISALTETHNIPESPQKQPETVEKYDSLLHQKLRECNGKLRQDLENFYQTIIGDANKNLNNIDQQLVRSQISLQNAVTSLKTIGTNSRTIKNKLQSLLSSNFIPNINTDDK